MAAAPSPPKPGRTGARARLILSSDYPEHPETSNSPLPRPLQREAEEEAEAEAAATPPPRVLTTLPAKLSREMTTIPGTEAARRQGYPHPREPGSGRCSHILHSVWVNRKTETAAEI